MEGVKSAGNMGRGKDISTIIEADKEEKHELEIMGSDLQVEKDNNEIKKRTATDTENESDFESKKHLDDHSDSDVSKPSRKILQKKKHRKLNSLDISSEDDHVSDEDFKGSSPDTEDEEVESGDSESDSDMPRRRRGGRQGTRRSTRARRSDRQFIDDSSPDESEAPRRKKTRPTWSEEEETEETDDSDSGWRKKRSRKSVPKKKSPGSSAKSYRKKRRGELEDLGFRGSKKKTLDEDVQTRRTRGRKINYIESDSDEESKMIKISIQKPKRQESEDEYVAQKDSEESDFEEPNVDKDDDDEKKINSEQDEPREESEIEEESEKEEIKPPAIIAQNPSLKMTLKTSNIQLKGSSSPNDCIKTVSVVNATAPILKELPSIQTTSKAVTTNLRPKPTTPAKLIPPVLQKFPEQFQKITPIVGLVTQPVPAPVSLDFSNKSVKASSISNDEDLDDEEIDEELEEEEEIDDFEADEGEIGDIGDLGIENADEDKLVDMMEEEEYGNKQLQLAAVHIARDKRKKEADAKKADRELKRIEKLKKKEEKDRLKEQKAREREEKKLAKQQSSIFSQNSPNEPKKRGRKSKVELLAIANAQAVAARSGVGPFMGNSNYPPGPAMGHQVMQHHPGADLMNISDSAAMNNPMNSSMRSDISAPTSTTSSPLSSSSGGKLGVAAPPQPFSASQPTPSVITRMLQNPSGPNMHSGMIRPGLGSSGSPVPRHGTLSPGAISTQPLPGYPTGKYFNTISAGEIPPGQFIGRPRGPVGMFRPPGGMSPMYPSPSLRMSGGSMYHSPHHPLDPSPSGGGPISIAHDPRSPNPKSGTPPPPYNRRYIPNDPSRHIPFPHNLGHLNTPLSHSPPTSHQSSHSVPTNTSPGHPGLIPPVHVNPSNPPPLRPPGYGVFTPSYSPYPFEQPPIAHAPPPTPDSYEGDSKSYEDEPGEFGGLVSYFSSQREDDLDS